jgi:hypothetical protein
VFESYCSVWIHMTWLRVPIKWGGCWWMPCHFLWANWNPSRNFVDTTNLPLPPFFKIFFCVLPPWLACNTHLHGHMFNYTIRTVMNFELPILELTTWKVDRWHKYCLLRRRYDKMNGLNEQELCKDPLCSPIVRRINTTDQINNCVFRLHGNWDLRSSGILLIVDW